jgi:uncharacterized protein YndB with AHSA1/START domain
MYNKNETKWLHIKGGISMDNKNIVPDIKKEAVFNAPIDKVWNAVATSEGIAAWFMPNDFEPNEGHEFHLQSPFGPSPCKVLEIDPPNKLVFSWDKDGWVVTFALKEQDGKTLFTLTHSGWKQAEDVVEAPGESHEVIRNRMNGGWEKIVHEKLRKAVEQ